ncbi:class F sortase [Thermoactinospora rubra]|uniref:class F sortase n=1 Tax=Thermoactinospora rubra TaxID=1088767 RepID=UPI001301EC48|nr:class F sortase [Thermoactinospora rubra]
MAEARRLAGVLLLLAAAVACKADGAARLSLPVVVQARAWPRPAAQARAQWARPVRVLVPRAGVDAPVIGLGGEDGHLGAPPAGEANLVGWDRQGPAPGDPGAAVLVGHLDTRAGPAVFARLRQVRPGDTVAVVRSDDRVAVYRVTGSQEAGKEDFPVRRVFRASPRPAIRLVTCGGRFDRVRHAYEDNLIVYGEHAGTYRLADLVERPGAA